MAVSSSSRPARMPELQSTKLWKEQRAEASPERTVVWTEPASNGKIRTDKRVPVVYYLSRNGQLEHPHFMEVPLSSPQALYLRDVINRLNVLRGKGMASMYSWSCKRNYKNRFVWHDLSENDFIYPAHGNEYVLKGSELLETTFMDTLSSFQRQQAQPLALLPPVGDNQITGSDLDYLKASEDRRRRNQSCSSIDFNLHEYSVYKAETSSSTASADASTQTEDKRRRRRPHGEIVEVKEKEPHGEDEIEISPPTSDSSPETLETLMKADKRQILRHETASEDPTASSHRVKDKAPSVLMQLISCGSISFKDCGTGQGLGMISQYKMRLPRVGGTVGRGRVKLEEKEYFSGSIVETKKEEFPSLKRSTSYGAERELLCCTRRFTPEAEQLLDVRGPGAHLSKGSSPPVEHSICPKVNQHRPYSILWRSSQLEVGEKEIEGIRAKCISRKPKTQQSLSSTQKEASINGLTCSGTIINSCT